MEWGCIEPVRILRIELIIWTRLRECWMLIGIGLYNAFLKYGLIGIGLLEACDNVAS